MQGIRKLKLCIRVFSQEAVNRGLIGFNLEIDRCLCQPIRSMAITMALFYDDIYDIIVQSKNTTLPPAGSRSVAVVRQLNLDFVIVLRQQRLVRWHCDITVRIFSTWICENPNFQIPKTPLVSPEFSNAPLSLRLHRRRLINNSGVDSFIYFDDS